ncbi:MAG: hypothetical protein QM765_43720 [Myxococcales bacterium]
MKAQKVDALIAILKVAPDVSDALNFVSVMERLEGELAARRAAETADAKTPLEVRRFFDRAEEDAAMSDPVGHSKVSNRVGVLFRKKDLAGLEAFQRDPANSRMHRLLAGSYLAQLGNESGLDLFEDPETIRSGHSFAIKSELHNLLASTKGPVHARIEKILPLYGEAKHPYERFKNSLDATQPPKQAKPAPRNAP